MAGTQIVAANSADDVQREALAMTEELKIPHSEP